MTPTAKRLIRAEATKRVPRPVTLAKRAEDVRAYPSLVFGPGTVSEQRAGRWFKEAAE